MEKEQFIATLQQIKAIIDQALGDSGQQPRLVKKASIEKQRPISPKTINIDFNKPIRPFIKEFGKGMSGPQRFTLLLSRLAKGDLKKEVQLKELEKQWNKMKALMDRMEFNNFFTSQAKDRDWVESKKRGSYNLRPNWKQILQ